MEDRTATMMIVRMLQEITNELRAIREELQQLNRLGQQTDPERHGVADTPRTLGSRPRR